MLSIAKCWLLAFAQQYVNCCFFTIDNAVCCRSAWKYKHPFLMESPAKTGGKTTTVTCINQSNAANYLTMPKPWYHREHVCGDDGTPCPLLEIPWEAFCRCLHFHPQHDIFRSDGTLFPPVHSWEGQANTSIAEHEYDTLADYKSNPDVFAWYSHTDAQAVFSLCDFGSGPLQFRGTPLECDPFGYSYS